jgi:dienelactone hydrolase
MALFGAAVEGGIEEVARAVDFDGGGGIFVVGSMAPGARLRSSAGGPTLTAAGSAGTDAFVAYVDAAGVPQWLLPLAGPGTEYAYDVVADGAGRAWVCGTFTATLATAAGTLVAATGGVNGFALQVSRTGSVERLLHIGPAAGVIPGECATDSNGRLYVSGSYFGAPMLNGTALPAAAAGATAGFVAAYGADGAARWARGVAGSAGVAWRGVAISGDPAEDVLAIGQFSGTAGFGATTLVAAPGATSAWVARVSSSDGGVRWAVAPTGESYGRGVRALAGEVVVAGAFRGNQQWQHLGAITASGGQDLFVARLTGDGAPVWARAVGGSSDDEGAEIAVDGSSQIHLAGSLAGTLTVGATTIDAQGTRDLLLAQFSDAGTLQRLQVVGGPGDDVAYALEVAGNGRVAYAGLGRGTVSDGTRSLAASGTYDALFGTLDALAVTVSPAPPPPTAAPTGVQRQDVIIPQQRGGSLQARLYAPLPATGPYPALSLLPGGGAPIDSVAWAADGLARAGYVVIVTQPASGGSLAAYDTAARSGIDFLLSPANPFAAATRSNRVGVAGWSLGARALTRTQEEDLRVSALVAWDNLALSETGDAGSPNCIGSNPTSTRQPRVPALGQASDFCGPPAETVDAKKTAYEGWRAAGQPAMQVVLAGSSHFVWGTQGTGTARQAQALYYTQAWFDLWLKDDRGASARLLARSIDGVAVEQVLSTRFRSAAAFDGRNCPDLRTACAP